MQCSAEDVSDKLQKKISDVPAVHISKPKAAEFQVRDWLLFVNLKYKMELCISDMMLLYSFNSLYWFLLWTTCGKRFLKYKSVIT